jgi:two-component system LytT family response regulator/two-component system response regulator AlgR
MNHETTLRVVVAEDEPLARERLSRMLREAGCEILAEPADGPALLAWIRASRQGEADALFLDIQMPGATTFEVLAEVDGPLPPLVFVTAHADQAVRAFEVRALDYLVKPVTRERLQEALRRIRQGEVHARQEPTAAPFETRFAARAGEGFVLLDLRRTSHFEAEDDQVWAWMQGTRFRTLWRRLSEVEAAFPRAGFLRIQRHILLRPQAVTALLPLGADRVRVRLGEGLELDVSRGATPTLRRHFGIS